MYVSTHTLSLKTCTVNMQMQPPEIEVLRTIDEHFKSSQTLCTAGPASCTGAPTSLLLARGGLAGEKVLLNAEPNYVVHSLRLQVVLGTA